MKLNNVEQQLLLAISKGQDVAKGDDYEPCLRLISYGLVRGITASNLRDGNSYSALEVTPNGREQLTR